MFSFSSVLAWAPQTNPPLVSRTGEAGWGQAAGCIHEPREGRNSNLKQGKQGLSSLSAPLNWLRELGTAQ